MSLGIMRHVRVPCDHCRVVVIMLSVVEVYREDLVSSQKRGCGRIFRGLLSEWRLDSQFVVRAARKCIL